MKAYTSDLISDLLAKGQACPTFSDADLLVCDHIIFSIYSYYWAFILVPQEKVTEVSNTNQELREMTPAHY